MSKPTCLGHRRDAGRQRLPDLRRRTPRPTASGPRWCGSAAARSALFSAAEVAERHLAGSATSTGPRAPRRLSFGDHDHRSWPAPTSPAGNRSSQSGSVTRSPRRWGSCTSPGRTMRRSTQWLELPSDGARAGPTRTSSAAIVEDSRRRGFLVEALTPAGRQLHSLVAGVAAYDLPDELRELVGEMVANLGERVYLGSDVAARTQLSSERCRSSHLRRAGKAGARAFLIRRPCRSPVPKSPGEAVRWSTSPRP